MWLAHMLLFRGGGLTAWIGMALVVQNIIAGLFNSSLVEFTHGWMYIFGVGVLGGAMLRAGGRIPMTRASSATLSYRS